MNNGFNFYKEIWNKFHLTHEGDTSGCIIKKEKVNKKKKKNSFQKEKGQSKEIPTRVNGCECHEEITFEEKAKLDRPLTEIERLKN